MAKAIRPKKFAAPFEGPFVITSNPSTNVYELDLPEGSKTHNKFHISLLRPFKESSLHPPDEKPPPVIYDSKRYEVESLLTHKKLRGRMHYYVKWKGYPLSEATWEPVHHIDKSLINAYWKQR